MPELAETRAALCSKKEEDDGTCQQVWSDLPEITGPIEAVMLALSKKDSSSQDMDPIDKDFDEVSLSLDVFAAEPTVTGSKAGARLGTVEALVGARADGAQWRQPDGALVAKSRPWSVAGWLSDAPDMRLGDCTGGFLAVVNMDPVQGPGGQRFPRLRASIRSEDGSEAFYVSASDFHIQGQRTDDAVYHVFKSVLDKGKANTRRLVGIFRRSGGSDETGLEWLVTIEKGCGLDLRVAVVVVAQLQAEGMRGAGWMLVLSILGVCLVVFNLLACCVAGRLVYRWAAHRASKAGAGDDELDHFGGLDNLGHSGQDDTGREAGPPNHLGVEKGHPRQQHKAGTRNPRPETPNPRPQTRDPKPQTPNPIP